MLRWGCRYVFESDLYYVQVWVGALSGMRGLLECKHTGSLYSFTVQNNEVQFGQAGVLLPRYLADFILALREAV